MSRTAGDSRPRLSGRAERGNVAGDTEAFFARVDNKPMKTLTITAARRHFGMMLDFAKSEPVLITRKNGKGAVIMSAEAYSLMTGIASFEQKGARKTRKTSSSRKSR